MTTFTPAQRLAAILTVEHLHAVPGNDWETGSHDVAPQGRAPRIAPRGMTYYVNVRTARGVLVLENQKYQMGSALSHDNRGREQKPEDADVLRALFGDADMVNGETFEGFCAEYGFDTDSRKALRIYLACQEALAAFQRHLIPGELSTLRDLLRED